MFLTLPPFQICNAAAVSNVEQFLPRAVLVDWIGAGNNTLFTAASFTTNNHTEAPVKG